MTVEEIRGGNGDYDNFPVGMRVLAVDDDPICLKLLDTLLRKCHYHVTITSQARVALNMLRENKDRYDLVISDVHMPDMDGFKLLELVGLEMDLPVIMLSANSDPKLVMKGVTHGACDYLVKPVRIEELRNIWQHVIRKKKIDPENQNQSSEQDKAQQGNGEGGQGTSFTGDSDQSGKQNKKRKDDEYDDEDNDDDNDDPSAQKKPRVVWSIELHRKFVAAVNQLGIEKAVPKRILDMMNVEGLTRENVASHLQKYRLYLKRISSVASQQANLYAALGSKDSAYLRMGSLDGLGDFRTLAGQGRLGNGVLSPYTPGGMLGRLNSPAGVSFHNLTSSALIPLNHAQNYSNSVNNLGKLHPSVSSASQNANLIQGTPSSLELDMHQNKINMRVGDFNSIDESRIFNPGSAFTDTNGGGFGSQPCLNMTSFNSDSFNVGVVGNSSDFLDHGRCNENWQSATQLSPLTEPNNHGNLPLGHMRDNRSLAGSNVLNPLDLSGSATPTGNSRRGLHSQEGFVGDVTSTVNQLHTQRWGDNNNNNNNIFSNMNGGQNNAIFNRKMDMSLIGRSNGGASTLLQREEIEKSIMDARRRPNEDYLMGQMRAQATLAPQGYDSLDDLMSAMIKREQEGTMLDGEFGLDAYSFRSTM